MHLPHPLWLATKNAHKVQELQAILGGADVRPASALGDLSWDETGDSFVANARIKAHAVRARLEARGEAARAWVLADDSGLSVDALGGAPGIHSARYAGDGATDRDNNAKLRRVLLELAGGDEARLFPARFTCVLYFIDHLGREAAFTGVCEGAITVDGRGAGGFGYDPLFVVEGQGGRTMAELGDEAKNRLSHRARALAAWRAAASECNGSSGA